MPPCSVRRWYLCIRNRNMSVACWTNSSVASLLWAAVGPWCQCWNIKSNEGKTQAIYFPKRRRMPGDDLQLNGRNIPFVNSVKYLGVIFDRRMRWRLHIKKTAAKASGTYIRTYCTLKSKHLGANLKLIVYRALIRSIKTHACPTWEFAANTHLIKLQRLQNRVLRTVGNLDRRTPVPDLHWRSKFYTCMIT
jgi:hypothetical protein